jgi:hypothetical protein
MATVEDYQRALENFVSDLRGGLGDDVVSVMLYGSMARGDCKPGRSDLIDAYVYFKDEVFEEKERFFKAFEVMVAACDRLSRTGLPYQHPFQYWRLDELSHTPALFRTDWWSDEHSRVVFGEDLRPQMTSTKADLAVARSSFFEARRMGHFLAAYLRKQELTEDDCEKILAGVKLLLKFLPAMACISLDIWTSNKQSIPSLLEMLPNLDKVSVQRITDFAQKHAVTVEETEELREVLRQTLNFIEDVHDEIVNHYEDPERAQ